MKKFAKRAAALLLAVVLTFSLAGCYSNDLTWCAKTGDTTVPIGVYIYYLNVAYNEASGQVDTASKVLESTIEGQDAETWIKNRAQQYVNKLLWLEQEMDRLGLEMTDADYDEASAFTYSYWTLYGGEESFGEYGIAQNSVDLAYSQYNIKYLKVFEALYGEGGELEASEDELFELYSNNYYNTEYFTVPLATADEEGNPVEMTEEEVRALAEELTGIVEDIEAGKMTVSEAAMECTGVDALEDTSYVTEINSIEGYTANYMPTEFTDTLAEMDIDDVTVFEADSYMVVMKRLALEGTLEDTLADANIRSDLLIDLKSDEYSEYVDTAASTVENVEMNEKAIARYQPKMFAKDGLEYGIAAVEEESSAEE